MARCGGGLYVPEAVPPGPGSLGELTALPYAQRAAHSVLWLPELSEQLPYVRIGLCLLQPSRRSLVVPLTGNLHMLELWHGTLAFKDMALQLLPRLLGLPGLTESAKPSSSQATCGIPARYWEGFAGVEGIRICVFYPTTGF